MESDIIKIKCPCCGAVLAIRNQVGLETKNVTCPNCHMKSKFTNYRQVNAKPAMPQNDADKTQYGNNGGDETRYNNGGDDETHFRPTSDATSLNLEQNNGFGYFVVQGSGQRLDIKEGMNVIGRKASTSNADLQIVTDSRKVSRRHSIVEKTSVPGSGVMYYISNAENKNPTYVNNSLVEDGDKFILKDGAVVRMADIALKFCISKSK